MKMFARGIVPALFVCAAVWCADGPAQDKPLKKIRWGVTAMSASNWIPWIAKDAKIYEKNGVDVVTVAHTVPGVQTKLLVRPEIRKPEDLKGKKVGISSLGSLGDFLERYIMRKHGLEPVRDVILLSVGGPPEVLQALMSGAIDGGDLSYPVNAAAERQGFRVLWDARKEVVYPSMSVVTRRKNIQDDRDTVMRMVRSHVEGIAYFKAHKDFSLKVLSKYLKITDRDLLEGSYEIYKEDFISVPYPIMHGLEATYEYVAGTRPEIRGRKPEEFMDSTFIAELDKSGFIKKLYGQK